MDENCIKILVRIRKCKRLEDLGIYYSLFGNMEGEAVD
jgi:hypothetical protein